MASLLNRQHEELELCKYKHIQGMATAFTALQCMALYASDHTAARWHEAPDMLYRIRQAPAQRISAPGGSGNYIDAMHDALQGRMPSINMPEAFMHLDS